MVASRKGHSRGSAFIYLIVTLLLFGCDNRQHKTIVTLHHKDPDSLEEVLKESLDESIQYKIIDSSIVFFSHEKNIQDTLELLGRLDRGPSAYTLNFKSTSNRYSTTKALTAISLFEKKVTTLDFFNIPSHLSIEPHSQHQSILHISPQDFNDLSEQHILLQHNQWEQINWGESSNVQVKLTELEAVRTIDNN